MNDGAWRHRQPCLHNWARRGVLQHGGSVPAFRRGGRAGVKSVAWVEHKAKPGLTRSPTQTRMRKPAVSKSISTRRCKKMVDPDRPFSWTRRRGRQALSVRAIARGSVRRRRHCSASPALQVLSLAWVWPHGCESILRLGPSLCIWPPVRAVWHVERKAQGRQHGARSGLYVPHMAQSRLANSRRRRIDR